MTYYISGPMSKVEGCNREAFRNAWTMLRNKGHEAITPFELNEVSGHGYPATYRTQLTRDLRAICGKADALYMLSGWEHSPGARAEHAVAVALNIKITYEGDV